LYPRASTAEADPQTKPGAPAAEKVPERTSKTQWVIVNNELVDLDEGTSLYFIPANPQSCLTYGGKNYRGIFVLRGNPEGAILVNVLNLEDYLKGVVPGELSPYLFGEIEALRAQAIASRTYALKNLGRFGDLGFDLYATPQSQLYEGMSLEHPLSSRAVEETKGEVAVYDGMLINALYSSTCGGATENAEAMFGGNAVPYLQSTQCLMESEWGWTLQTGQSLPTYFVGGGLDSSASFFLYLDLEPGDAVQWIEHEGQVRLLQVQSIPLASVVDQPFHYHYWQVRTAREDLEARLNEYYPIGKLIDLVPVKHGESKRVIELFVIGRESQVLVTGLKIRQVLNLRDNPFVIDRETDEEGQPTHFIFLGRGWGHGVGLCQVGAFRMAQKGATYEEILKKYYRGIKIEKRTGY
jgi:stage II sporulation protein D